MLTMASRVSWAFFISSLFFVVLVNVAGAAPADTDRSFGQEGRVVLEGEPGGYTVPSDMAIGRDGSIYVLRTAYGWCSSAACDVRYLLSRLRPNGGRDVSFGAAGTSVALGALEGGATGRNASLALLPDGQVVVATTEHGRLVLWRLDSSGALDPGFGVGGIADYDLGTPIRRVRVAAQADGRIVIAAEPERGYGADAVVVARFTADGAFDPTFHAGAPIFTSLGSGFGSLSLARSGATVLAGPDCCEAVGRAVHVVRFDPNGAADAAFGRRGEVFVDDIANGVGVDALLVRPGGKIYVVGSGRNGDAFALRLRPNGRLDRRFGHRGIAYMRRSYIQPAGAAVDRAGRLWIFGTSPTGTSRGPGFGSSRLTVLRRLPNGRRDTSFAAGSFVRLGAPNATQVAGGGLQRGRRLVVLASHGYCVRTCEPPVNFLVRFIGGSAAPRCFGHRATIVGTRHGEKLVGTRHRDVIAALAGNDTVLGRGGDDLICGGRGNDRLIGGRGRDRLSGGPGRNRVRQ